ncbi:MAG: AAA family ATPase [Chitinivibrionales bacterium]|nr:AAA family ATPase [Chitinivibrionales bacterium]MBD3395768.1 AAA family ATPase [Chitinivibrionales bacterium]
MQFIAIHPAVTRLRGKGITMANDMEWLRECNPAQKKAVTHGDGPLLVVAGAGTGKTRTLAYRVAYLISRGVSPDRILLLTFTRRAAEEMLKRASSATAASGADVRKVWGGTFHATANRLLRMYAKPVGLSPDFTIMDQGDAEDLINVVRHEKGFGKSDRRFPRKRTCLAIYSRRVNGTEDLPAVLKRYFPWCEEWHDELKDLFKEYVDRKQRHNVLDYDDLLLYWYYLVQNEELGKSIEDRFDHILVDEYQDTNRIQAGILRGIRQKNRNIMVVGDDAQSIYSFRSATVRNMLDFPRQFDGATIVALEQNYRSVQSILTTTNLLISQAAERYTKDLWSNRPEGQRPRLITCTDEDSQNDTVIAAVLEHYEQGIPLRKQAVLFRASYHSNSLELALARKNIPFHKYGGLRFLEAAHIKDLVNLLRILENPQDQIAWFRVTQLLDGVGPATAAAAFTHIAENGFNPASIARFHAPPAARDGFRRLGGLMEDLTSGYNKPSVEIETICRFYLPLLKANYENPDARARDVTHLTELSNRYKSRRAFLTDLALDPPRSTGDLAGPPSKDDDWLVLSTIHSAKGCEWDSVYLICASDGCLPSDMATGSQEEIEEELRLAYVSMTRARDFLYVLWPMRYYHGRSRMGDAHTYSQLSRFFTDDVAATMDTTAEPADTLDSSDTPSGISDTGIASRIRDMWE